MRRDIFINVSPFEKRIALLEDGRLIELVVDKPDNQRIVGNIYKGRVVSVLPGMQAAFVDIGLEKAAFLHAADIAPVGAEAIEDDDDSDDDVDPRRRDRAERPIAELLREGQEILVQVVKEPISTKGAKVTGFLSLAGRFLVCMPNTTFIGVSKKSRDHGSRRKLKQLVQELRRFPDVGYIVRTNGLNESEEEFRIEMGILEEKWAFIKSVASECEAPRMVLEENEAAVGILRDYFSEKVDKVMVDDKDFFQKTKAYIRQLSPDLVSRVHLYDEKVPLFDEFEIEQEVQKVYADKVWIRKGSHLVIQTTEAMTTIDVNTGRNVGRDDQAATIMDTNISAAKEIAKQLRLRDLGGIVVVDFIDMDSEDDRERLVKEFRKALRGDRAPITVASSISQFGLLEMTRKRVREALVKTVSEPCSHCEGSGNVLLPSSVVASLERWVRRNQARNGPKEIAIVVHSRIIDYLVAERSSAFHRLESFGVNIELVDDPDAPADSYRIFHSRSLEELTPPAQRGMTAQAVRELDTRWVLGTYARQPLFLERGDGAWVWDTDGRKYLDLTAGIAVNALGHADPVVVAAIHEQASRIAHASNLYFSPLHGRMAEVLCRHSGLDKAFFCNSGTEANEAAFKFVRKYWYDRGSAWRHEIVSFQDSFHGRTYGALAATGQDRIQTGFGPLLPGFVRSPLTSEGLREFVGAHTAAVILEPILAEGGVIEPSAEFVATLNELQDKYGFLLIADEIQTGLGRTGEWFAFSALGLRPDLVTLAKPLGGGLPLGAVLLAQTVADAIKPGDHGTTFGGNPVAVAAGLAVLDRPEKPGFLEAAREVATRLRAGLQSLNGRGPFGEVRGRGFLIGVKVSCDPGKIIEAAREEGLIVYRAGAEVLRMLPPLVLTADQADFAIEGLRRVADRI